MKLPKVLIIAGPTAVGKTDFALTLSEHLNMEIISADSAQVYKSLDAGTSKPTIHEMRKCKHHLINVVSPTERFNAFDFVTLAKPLIAEITARGNLPVIVGGTGLYIESLLYGFEFDKKTKKTQAQYDYYMLALTQDREKLYSRIDERVDLMIQKGLVDEVRVLREIGVTGQNRCMSAIGYSEIWEFLEGNIEFEDAVKLIKKNTRNYAKRQITWFKHMKCDWIDIEKERDAALKCLVKRYSQFKKS